MDTSPPPSDPATTALALLHEYVDGPTYETLNASQRALVREAIENLTAVEAAASTEPVAPVDAPSTGADEAPRCPGEADALIWDFKVS